MYFYAYGGKYMGSTIVKRNTYRLVDSSSFELPVPFRFEVMKKDVTIAEYEIIDGDNIVCNIATKHKEDMLTTVHRPLVISDIHFLFSCRVFQDFTPYTQNMLDRVGLQKYNVLDILYKTHGVIPYDSYWIRFEDEQLTYEEVYGYFNKIMSDPIPPAAPVAAPSSVAEPKPNVDEILSQHTIDISGIVAQNNSAPEDAENMLRTAVAFSHPEAEEEDINNNKMSENEIEALLAKAGIASPAMSESEINAVFAVNDQPEESDTVDNGGGMMSEEAIAALLAANAAPAPEPEPAPVEASAGGNMSEEAIAALLAANAAPAPEPTPAPVEASAGGNMSEEAIAALLAANAAPAPEPEPAPVEASAGGNMSEEAIAALLAANAAPAPEPEPAPVEASTGGNMSEEATAPLLAANAAPAPEPEPAPVEASAGGNMSEEAIAALLSSMQDDANK